MLWERSATSAQRIPDPLARKCELVVEEEDEEKYPILEVRCPVGQVRWQVGIICCLKLTPGSLLQFISVRIEGNRCLKLQGHQPNGVLGIAKIQVQCAKENQISRFGFQVSSF